MSNLFILNEIFTNGLIYGLLNTISLAAILCGIFVVISKNPIVSVLFLIGLFLSIAGYLMMLGINFIGLSYLLVYVGAVSILFLFILMLINVRVSELTTDNNNSVPLGIMTGIFFTLTWYKLLPSNLNPTIKYNAIDFNIEFKEYLTYDNIAYLLNDLFFSLYKNLFFVSSQIWDGALAESSHITSIGAILYTVYPVWLILTSLVLLLAMVGAIVITINK